MNKKIKNIAILVIVAIAGVFAARYYAYHGGKRDIQSEEVAYTIASKPILFEFTSNVVASNKKYLEKPVAILGTVTSINDKEVILDNAINCQFLVANVTIKIGQKVTVKGRVVGYDDLLGELKLDQCNISTNK